MTRITLKDIYDIVNRMEDKFDDTFVTKEEFKPVKVLVYGFTGLLITIVVVAMVTRVVS